MRPLATWLRRYGARLLAAVAVLALYELAQLPTLDPAAATAMAARFKFTAEALPTVPGPPQQYLRPVNPGVANIAGWISAVGAGAALYDLDGDGLPNDVCYVDTRTDQVIVAPVPGTGARYEPFVLDPAPLPYDAATMAPMGCLPGDLNEEAAARHPRLLLGAHPSRFSAPARGGARPRRFPAPGDRAGRRAVVHECRDFRRSDRQRPRRPGDRQLFSRWRPHSRRKGRGRRAAYAAFDVARR